MNAPAATHEVLNQSTALTGHNVYSCGFFSGIGSPS